jgi:hypothetical protein
VHDDVRAGGVEPAADGGTEALRAAGDEYAATGKGQGGFHVLGTIRVQWSDDVTIPEPVRRVSIAGSAR